MCFVNHNRASVEYLRIRNRAGECHTARVVSVIMVDNVIKWFKKKKHCETVLGDNQSRHQIPSVNQLLIITLLQCTSRARQPMKTGSISLTNSKFERHLAIEAASFL